MANFTRNSESRNASGLYRVWVPLHDDGRVPLVAIWIDPTMTASETQPQQKSVGLPETNEAVIADEFEDPDRCIAYAAMAAELVPNAA